jgi:uncharacterized membrane protein YfcA
MMLALALGVLVGVLLGVTGAGGGILAVPALVAGFGWSMQQAAPVALIAVAGSAAIGALDGLRRKIARYRAALLMAACGMSMTPLGARAAHGLPQQALMVGFAMIMLMIAVRMLSDRQSADERRAELALWSGARINPETGRFIWTAPTAVLLGAIGATGGFLTGLLGVGGGFVLVPLLRRFTELSMQAVVATALMVVALVGTGGVFATLAQGATIEPLPTALFAGASASGMVIGRIVGGRLPPDRVQQAFAGVLVLVATGMLAMALTK